GLFSGASQRGGCNNVAVTATWLGAAGGAGRAGQPGRVSEDASLVLRRGQADTAGVEVGEDGVDRLVRVLSGRVEPQADPVGLLPQDGLEAADRPAARPVSDAVPLVFPLLDGGRVR